MDRNSIFDLIVALLLGVGAVGGGWASYQSSQWGGTATEDYGKAATTATRASTQYNEGITIANRDSALDIQAKQSVLGALTSNDPLVKERELAIAKYLYTQQMTKQAYESLGFNPKFHTKDRDTYLQFSDDDVAQGLEHELGQAYFQERVKTANATFAEADNVFAEGQKVSGFSTQFGLTGMFFTVGLFLGGVALVIKNPVRWVFVIGGYAAACIGLAKLFGLPWYHA